MPRKMRREGGLLRNIEQTGVDISVFTVKSRLKKGMSMHDAIHNPAERQPKLGDRIAAAIKLLEKNHYIVSPQAGGQNR